MPASTSRKAKSSRKPRTPAGLPQPKRAPCVPFAAVWERVRSAKGRAVCVGTYKNKQSAYNTASAIRQRHRDSLRNGRIEVWVKGVQVYANTTA